MKKIEHICFIIPKYPTQDEPVFTSWDIVKIRFKDKYKKSHFTIRPISYIAMLVLNFYMLFLLRRMDI